MRLDDLVRRSSKKKRHSLYTIEFGAPVDAVRSGTLNHNRDDSLSPKPMTPRSEYYREIFIELTHFSSLITNSISSEIGSFAHRVIIISS